MIRAIVYNVTGVLAVLAVMFFKIPIVWVILGVLVLVIIAIFNPFIPSVENIPKGFAERKVNTGKVILNYIEGPNNGPPLLFIPGQIEFWQGYKLVIPNFSKNYHVFVVDVRGHGKSAMAVKATFPDKPSIRSNQPVLVQTNILPSFGLSALVP